jgi:transposase
MPIRPKFESEFSDVKNLDQNTRYNLSQRNIVGCDPGKGDLVYMADSKGNTLSFSSVKRRFDSKQKQNKRAIYKIRKQTNVEQYESYLSNYNSKTTSFYNFKEFIRVKEYVRQNVIEVYQHKCFRSMRLRSYIEGRRCDDKFLESIGETFGQNCIIMYGDWDENGHIKNFISTKGIGLRRLIEHKFQTITTSESYTSRRCCECGYDLRSYKADIDSQWSSKRQDKRIKSGQEIHRLRVCEGCIKSNEARCWSSGKGIPFRNNCVYSSYVDVSPEGKRIVYRSRDKNAALNILKNGLSWIFNGCQHPWFTKEYSSFSQHPCLQGVRKGH